MNVFLADLHNSYFKYVRNSVPLGLGYVHAYLLKRFADTIQIDTFVKFERLHDTILHKKPDMVAFGSYAWNTALTINSAQWIRERYPDVIIAVAGPNVSQDLQMLRSDLLKTPMVDFYLPNEGETPMGNLVQAFLDAPSPQVLRETAVTGCIAMDRRSGELIGTVLSRFDGNINEIPSPYLGGLLDHYLADKEYLPLIQTARGCPYSCTFCVSGKETWRKIHTFDTERVKAEIDYIAERAANRFLRLADENVGILERDVELAEYIAQKKRETGFPMYSSLYTDKHPSKRVKSIVLTLRDLLPFNISFQSVTLEVLKNIKRINLKEREVDEAVRFARENNLMLTTELIFPLPGETIETFLASFDRLIALRFESIVIIHLRLLKGTEMDLPEVREQYGFITKFSVSENGYTRTPQLESVEIDESVIATNTVSIEESHKFNRFIFLVEYCYYHGFVKELMLFFESCHIKTSELLMRISKDQKHCPTLFEYSNRYALGVRDLLFDTPEEVEQHIKAEMRGDSPTLQGIIQIEDNLIVEMLMKDLLVPVIEEISQVGLQMYKEQYGRLNDRFVDALETLKKFILLMDIRLDESSPLEYHVDTYFDVYAWKKNHYLAPLSDYHTEQPVKIGLHIRNFDAYKTLWDASNMTLKEKQYKRIITFNSSVRRRIVIEPSAEGVNMTI